MMDSSETSCGRLVAFLAGCAPHLHLCAGVALLDPVGWGGPEQVCRRLRVRLLGGKGSSSGAERGNRADGLLEFMEPVPAAGGLDAPVRRYSYQTLHLAGRVCAAAALSDLDHGPARTIVDGHMGKMWSCSERTASGISAADRLLLLNSCLSLVPKSGSGSPVWPEGYVGSITHTGRAAAALVARTTGVLVGIDGEGWLSEERAQSVRRRILNDEELTVLGEGALAPHRKAVTLGFSAKEAVFKALFPVVGFSFGFHSVRVVAASRSEVTLSLADSRLTQFPFWGDSLQDALLVARYCAMPDAVWVALVHRPASEHPPAHEIL
jgi:4'-phosphopantetheinyl transferase EntD